MPSGIAISWPVRLVNVTEPVAVSSGTSVRPVVSIVRRPSTTTDRGTVGTEPVALMAVTAGSVEAVKVTDCVRVSGVRRTVAVGSRAPPIAATASAPAARARTRTRRPFLRLRRWAGLPARRFLRGAGISGSSTVSTRRRCSQREVCACAVERKTGMPRSLAWNCTSGSRLTRASCEPSSRARRRTRTRSTRRLRTWFSRSGQTSRMRADLPQVILSRAE